MDQNATRANSARVSRRQTRPLLAGGRVFVAAPSSPFPRERLQQGVDRMRDCGFVVDFSPHLLRATHAYLNGSDRDRIDELNHALASDYDAIFIARGGYGLTRIISRIDFPDGSLPTVMGFSDATALLSRLCDAGIRCVHGPLMTSLADESEKSLAHTLAVLAQSDQMISLDCRPQPRATSTSDVGGWLFAANLCVFTHLIGTKALPNLSGAVVVLEEVGERPYKIDRMLTHLRESGSFDGVKAIVLGQFSGCVEAKEGRIPAPSVVEIVAERFPSIPVFDGLSVGHQAPNFALPLGVDVTLSHVSAGTASLQFNPRANPVRGA